MLRSIKVIQCIERVQLTSFEMVEKSMFVPSLCFDFPATIFSVLCPSYELDNITVIALADLLSPSTNMGHSV